VFGRFKKSVTALLISLSGRLPVASDNLKRFFDFGDCFWLCFKLAVKEQ